MFKRPDWASALPGPSLPGETWKSAKLGDLDRTKWAAAATLRMFGVRIGIRANVPELLNLLLSPLPPGSEALRSTTVERLYSAIVRNTVDPAGTDCRCNLLFSNARQLASSAKWGELRESFESDLDFYVARTTRNWLFVHAGVVAWKGQAIILPGRSYAGKTTLVRAFLKLGATYYSDEYAVLDQGGRVHPFPRALSVRANGVATKIAAEQLGAPIGRAPLPVGLVIVTQYKPSTHWRPKVLSPGAGVLGLLQNTLTARRCPQLAIKTLERAIRKARVLRGARGEAEEAVGWVVRYFG
jgi:hypothetical protein